LNTRRIKKARQEIRKQEKAFLDSIKKNKRLPFLVRIGEAIGWHGPYMRWDAKRTAKALIQVREARKRAAHNVARKS